MTPVEVLNANPVGNAWLMLYVSVAPFAVDALLMEGCSLTLRSSVNVIFSSPPLYFKPDGATAFTVMAMVKDTCPPELAAVKV
jgi:hypothetical protein